MTQLVVYIHDLEGVSLVSFRVFNLFRFIYVFIPGTGANPILVQNWVIHIFIYAYNVSEFGANMGLDSVVPVNLNVYTCIGKEKKDQHYLFFFTVFKILELDDRITLVQDSIYSMAVLNFSRLFNVETKEYSFFGCSREEEKKIIEFYPELKSVKEDLLYVGDLIKTVAFDDIELTCLTGLLCFNAGISDYLFFSWTKLKH